MGKQAERNRAAAVAANEPRRCRECGSPLCHDCRLPYVGDGADGARRSAQIDREESHTLDRSDPGVERLEESAVRWERQAERLESKR